MGLCSFCLSLEYASVLKYYDYVLDTPTFALSYNSITGELIPGSAGHTLLSSLSNNFFDV